MENNNAFGEISWENEDIANALELCDYEPTEENVQKIRKALDNHFFTDWMIEQGWDYIYQTIDEEMN